MTPTESLHIPTEDDLARLYYELAQLGAPALGDKRAWTYCAQNKEDLIALASELSRYDARLMTILVQWLQKEWHTLNPLKLRHSMKTLRYPQTVCVVFTFLKMVTEDREFELLIDYVCASWTRVDPAERYFISGARPASHMAKRETNRNLSAYAHWGFIGTERPVANPINKAQVGRYDSFSRTRILLALAKERRSFALNDYLEALDGTISRQQALADLKRTDFLKLTGHGRGARWTLKKRSRLSTG